MNRRVVGAMLTLASCAGPTTDEQRVVRGDLLVAAAGSLSGLAPDLTRAFHDASGRDVRFTFGGSNTLARQIVEGARVDVFISADVRQMDLVERAGRIVAGTRVNVVGNQLVIVVPTLSRHAWTGPDDLGSTVVSRLAMGDPDGVPVGVYGRRWLEAARLWSAVASKVIPLPSSPAVLAAVREGRAQAGIVYATDARAERAVRIAHVVDPADAPEILYPAAAIAGGREPDARLFLAFLRSAAAVHLFEAAGFRRPIAAARGENGVGSLARICVRFVADSCNRPDPVAEIR